MKPRATESLSNKLQDCGWSIEPSVLMDEKGDWGSNPKALVFNGSRYFTAISSMGVNFALDNCDIYIHKNHVYRGDPTVYDPTTITVAAIVAASEIRGKGYASMALKSFCSVSTALGITVSLEPLQVSGYGKGTRTTLQLRKWYGRHGFVADPDSCMIMRRKP